MAALPTMQTLNGSTAYHGDLIGRSLLTAEVVVSVDCLLALGGGQGGRGSTGRGLTLALLVPGDAGGCAVKPGSILCIDQ